MSAAAPRELPVAAFLDVRGAQSPEVSSGSEGEDGSDSSPRCGRGTGLRRLGLLGGALAGVGLLVLAAGGAAEASRAPAAPLALDGERAAPLASQRRLSNQHRRPLVLAAGGAAEASRAPAAPLALDGERAAPLASQRRLSNQHRRPSQVHKAYHAFATPVQTESEQPASCNGTALVKGRQGCCAGQVFDLATTSCCGTMLFYFTSLSCCDHGNGTATLYEPYAQNCCDDAAVSNRQRGICTMRRRERSCCTRHGRHRRPRRLRAATAVGGEDGVVDQDEGEE
eukprot:CAMPEP_0198607964 /NCGR_PEP_ID=MMETSP1462-20131121/155658_1 /TAXON_ID=1333877 /ORGANISM="Brandtodinium nutriculum, Strain RCC3387" /LENGTH=282 /DNA_ID=CAMNT_0044339769 /DNA_START=9 /DNA_END=857 /DNA_ORIENTATION=-